MGKGQQKQKFQMEDMLEEGKTLFASGSYDKEVLNEDMPAPPDGGWGWVIVAASFLCNMVLDGIGYSFGILLKPLMAHFDEGKATIAMV